MWTTSFLAWITFRDENDVARSDMMNSDIDVAGVNLDYIPQQKQLTPTFSLLQQIQRIGGVTAGLGVPQCPAPNNRHSVPGAQQ
jgi:hypothetical protein